MRRFCISSYLLSEPVDGGRRQEDEAGQHRLPPDLRQPGELRPGPSELQPGDREGEEADAEDLRVLGNRRHQVRRPEDPLPEDRSGFEDRSNWSVQCQQFQQELDHIGYEVWHCFF